MTVSDEFDIEAVPTPPKRRLPDVDVQVDFGERSSGYADPMPEPRRKMYETRIRNARDAQAAGAARASQLFIR